MTNYKNFLKISAQNMIWAPSYNIFNFKCRTFSSVFRINFVKPRGFELMKSVGSQNLSKWSTISLFLSNFFFFCQLLVKIFWIRLQHFTCAWLWFIYKLKRTVFHNFEMIVGWTGFNILLNVNILVDLYCKDIEGESLKECLILIFFFFF